MANKDYFASLDALKLVHTRWKHYRLRIFDKRSEVTVIAPHGGFIEPGTSFLAKVVAAHDCNLFDFQGLLKTCSMRLHVTSVNFRDPRLSDLLERSKLAVSLHSMGDVGNGEIWVGGLALRAKQDIVKQLRARGFKVRAETPRYKGVHPGNVVNLPSGNGVQLELSNAVLKELFAGGVRFDADDESQNVPPRMKDFVEAVRVGLGLAN